MPVEEEEVIESILESAIEEVAEKDESESKEADENELCLEEEVKEKEETIASDDQESKEADENELCLEEEVKKKEETIASDDQGNTQTVDGIECPGAGIDTSKASHLNSQDSFEDESCSNATAEDVAKVNEHILRRRVQQQTMKTHAIRMEIHAKHKELCKRGNCLKDKQNRLKKELREKRSNLFKALRIHNTAIRDYNTLKSNGLRDFAKIRSEYDQLASELKEIDAEGPSIECPAIVNEVEEIALDRVGGEYKKPEEFYTDGQRSMEKEEEITVENVKERISMLSKYIDDGAIALKPKEEMAKAMAELHQWNGIIQLSDYLEGDIKKACAMHMESARKHPVFTTI